LNDFEILKIVKCFFDLLSGFGTGAFTLAVPAYVSEIAERSVQVSISPTF